MVVACVRAARCGVVVWKRVLDEHHGLVGCLCFSGRRQTQQVQGQFHPPVHLATVRRVWTVIPRVCVCRVIWVCRESVCKI
jgi:hypothetical protein